ncbi:hypothetical protein PHLGIDRAFT_122504 [Phlebiopsis gigantea 11061_1 CR5-6]|uniref:Uncharacterized protein n=1 Tax=Phlebiopsis gigantea (strain 11061_1 CR5-6) TaxID=745531 RepID=A0A0C3PBP9_PHLG1|nr:hypothetical protein PHLGIDRAFT_122504 [Phlebiopsis gigantea 11061_1 CR5-6]
MVKAQSISSQCESALAGVLTDSGAACLNPTGLIPILQASNDTSLIAPLNTWDQAMCKSSVCTNATLASVTSDITSGCQTELGSLGLGNISSAELTTIVQQLYPSVREILCSQDTSNNTLCPTEFLTNLQSVTGTFTLASAETFLNQVVSSGVPNIPKSVECTDCTKQWYNIIKAAFPDVVSSDAESNVSGTCGSDFVNGQTPSDVAAFGTSGSSTSGDTSGAASTHVDARRAFVAVAVLSPLVALL